MADITIQLDGATTGTSLPQALEQVIEATDRLPDDRDQGGYGAEAIVGELVPIFLFLAVALTFVMKYYFQHRTRRDAQATVRAAIERGEPLSPELLDRLVQPAAPVPMRNDMRRGVIGIALGVGIGAIGVVVGDEDALRALLAIACVPLVLGIAYLVLWRLSGDKART
jgi:hypothetical protein